MRYRSPSDGSIAPLATLATGRRRARVLIVAALAALSACGADAPTSVRLDQDPLPVVRLKDVVIPSLPSPYYHFEYDASGRISFVSFASDARRYDVRYVDGRISEMRNNVLVNKDRLVYSRDDAGRVVEVHYLDVAGVLLARVRYDYLGDKLVAVKRERSILGRLVLDKTVALTYDAQGNLSDLAEGYPAIDGFQTAANFVDHYEGYDSGINVDGFTLLHTEFGDHFVLLPRVVLQTGNPARVVRTGDGLTYTIDYTYRYDAQNRPVATTGTLVVTGGGTVGQRFQVGSQFTYY